MARDIFSIPGMSAEVERLFSSAKLILPPARNSLLLDGQRQGSVSGAGVRMALF